MGVANTLMTLAPTPRLGLRRILTLLAMAPACVWFLAPARAGCAHPAGSTMHGLSDYRLDSLRTFGIAGSLSEFKPARLDSPWSSSPDRPCSGPNCKRNSAPSQAPTPIPYLMRIDGCLDASRLDRVPQHVSALRMVEPSLYRLHAANTLERPPRSPGC